MRVTLRVPQTPPLGVDEGSPWVDVEAWWPDEWGLPVEGQRVTVETGRVRLVQRVVLEPGGLPASGDHRARGTVRVELEGMSTR